jgi:hypothetical protein
MQSLHAHSPTEAEYYLKVTPCPRCAKGPWHIETRTGEQDARTMLARCGHCDLEHRFEFFCPDPDAATASAAGQDVVNPSPEPSRIIDVGQWLSLFFFLIETASKSPDKTQTRQMAFQAAQCLDEALKFYDPQLDLPPATAFYIESSRQALERFPERFSRRRLRELRSRLPDTHVMAQRLAQEAAGTPPRRKAKWRFWRK